MLKLLICTVIIGYYDSAVVWIVKKVTIAISKDLQLREPNAAKTLSLWQIVTVTSVSETGVTVSDADC